CGCRRAAYATPTSPTATAASTTSCRFCSATRPPASWKSLAPAWSRFPFGDFVILNWRAVCGQCRACKRGRPQYCFDTHNAAENITLADGTELTPARGIGAFAEKTLVHAGQCTRVDPTADPSLVGLLGCGVMA